MTQTDRDIRRLNVVEHMNPQNIADLLGHSVDSVRGRISRASALDRLEIARELAEATPTINEGVEIQKDIIRRSELLFSTKQEALQDRGGLATALFMSDMHLPYTNWSAVRLTLQILDDVKPDYVSGMNDAFDFTSYGRWPDTRPPAARLWDTDIANPLAVLSEINGAIKKASPTTTILAVQGNHCNWMYRYLRERGDGFGEHGIAAFMTNLYQQGVLQFVNGLYGKENVIQLSPGLKWLHGTSASGVNQSIARAAQDTTRGKGDEEGIYFNTVAGHVHRSFESSINGLHHWNSGTLGTKDPTYLKHAPDWDAAIVINRYDPNGRYTEGEIVKFRERGGNLVARYNGVTYDEPLKG